MMNTSFAFAQVLKMPDRPRGSSRPSLTARCATHLKLEPHLYLWRIETRTSLLCSDVRLFSAGCCCLLYSGNAPSAQGSGKLGAEQYSFFGGFDDAASDALGGLEVSLIDC